MSEMIERVARALNALDNYAARECEQPEEPFERYPDRWLAFARAAIEAMREPTDAMLRAGYEATHNPNDAPAGGFTRWATWDEVLECPGLREEKATAYRAAIDAALTTSPTPPA